MALDFVAGCFGGCAGVLVGHPFDTVKVHLQTQDPHNPRYRGTFHCLRTIAAKDSIRGLYRGLSSPIGGVAFANAIVFGVYGNVQRYSSDPTSLQSHFMAGSLAGLAQSIIVSPMELAKTRLQLQTSNQSVGQVQFQNPLQCLRHIWRVDGVRGVFRGIGITAVRDVPGMATYFVTYEMLTRNNPNAGVLYTLWAGGMAGVISWIFSVPMDVIKSRIQADGNGATQRRYNGVVDCVRKSYRTEGWSFLTRGLGSTLIRAFPMNAACFFVVSWILKNYSVESLSIEIVPPAQCDVNSLVLTGSANSNTTSLMVTSTQQQNATLPIRNSHLNHLNDDNSCGNYINVNIEQVFAPNLTESDFICLGI